VDLNHVTAFVRVVQDGSFTAAARALGIPKSSVSRSVAQLEHDLGVRLLHRTTRKLHLTDAGTAFHERVARALADIDEATNATSDLQRELRGAVRISAPFDVGVWAIAAIVTRFARRHPGVSVETRLSSRAVDLVSEGFDLAVRAGALRDTSLVARKAGRLDLALYASAKWVARRGAPKNVDDLAKHPCVAFRSDAGTMPWSLRGPNGEEATVEPRGAISADDISFLKKAVLAGAGIALLPSFLAAREERAKKLVRVLPEWRYEGAALNVVYPSARYVPQRVIAFREYLVAELAKITRRCEEIEARS
jgi:DNA-binding transcriptional LysR family regulator